MDGWAPEISGKAGGEASVQVTLHQASAGEGHSAGVLVLDPEILASSCFLLTCFLLQKVMATRSFLL